MHRRCAMLAVGIAAMTALSLGSGTSADEAVRVYYPPGDCDTRMIEVQIFDREREHWAPHPLHPTVQAGTCQDEDPGVLMNEIRIRCIDPDGRAQASDWRVGFDVFRPRKAPACP